LFGQAIEEQHLLPPLMYTKFVVGLLSSYDFVQDRANAFQQSERLPWTGIRAPQQRYACIERFHFRRSAKSSSGNIYFLSDSFLNPSVNPSPV